MERSREIVCHYKSITRININRSAKEICVNWEVTSKLAVIASTNII